MPTHLQGQWNEIWERIDSRKKVSKTSLQNLVNDTVEWFQDKAEKDKAVLVKTLQHAEAALADIGDADREPEDDVKWCEDRAAEAIPMVRKTLTDVGAKHTGLVIGGGNGL
jgi:hypothetical protein